MNTTNLKWKHVSLFTWQINLRPVISRDFSWFQDSFTNVPLPQNIFERSSHQGNKEVACIVSKPLWRCGESVNPLQEVQGVLSSRPKGELGPLLIFRILIFTFVKLYLWNLVPRQNNDKLYFPLRLSASACDLHASFIVERRQLTSCWGTVHKNNWPKLSSVVHEYTNEQMKRQ